LYNLFNHRCDLLEMMSVICLITFGLLLVQIQSLNVAVLMVGEFRGWQMTRHTFNHYLFDHPANKDHDIDVFVSSYDATSQKDRNASEYALKAHKVRT